jgi:UDP-N-acetylglucosamine 4,6-dehydratase
MMQGGEIFVPRIPSMRIMDLVTAIAPGCQVRFTGIRPGEKIHEVLVSEDEARQTMQLEDLFVIQPSEEMMQGRNWTLGTPLPSGFVFTSDRNDQWLSLEDLRSITSLVEV